MSEKERIELLHKKYLSLRKNTPWEKRDGEECKAYHEWYDSAYVYFKSLEHLQNDPDFKIFVNAENISTPITYELDIVDEMINLQASGKSHLYLEERGILLHRIIDDELPLAEEEESGIYKAMKNTPWGFKAFGGEFSNNDFSNVGKVKLKQYQPITGWTYNNKECYIYMKDGNYFFTDSRADVKLYNLNHENDQKKFYYDWVLDLRVDCYEGRCTFKSYTFYDILMNYKSFFRL